MAVDALYGANYADVVECKAVSPGTTADSSRRGSILISEGSSSSALMGSVQRCDSRSLAIREIWTM